MAKDPAFLFYSQDFIMGTSLMSNAQTGLYIKLLCFQHQHGGLIDSESFDDLVKDDRLIRAKFIKTDDGYYNERLMQEMNDRAHKSSNLSANAKKRWENRSKSNAIAKPKHMPIENENENEIRVKTKRTTKTTNTNPPEVRLSDSDRAQLIDKLGKHGSADYIERLDLYIGSKGDKYKSHLKTILAWWKKDGKPVNKKDVAEREYELQRKDREEFAARQAGREIINPQENILRVLDLTKNIGG